MICACSEGREKTAERKEEEEERKERVNRAALTTDAGGLVVR